MNGNTNTASKRRAGLYAIIAIVVATCVVACGTLLSRPRQGWNPSYGPVVPHDKFPADCSLCHTGGNWTTIKPDFTFDHEKETGVPLVGAHQKVSCLLCHNDRGPVKVFADQGCAGCHLDRHRGELGRDCASCHNQSSWLPRDQITRHNRTRFPLVGAHAAAGCAQCHPGAQTNNFAGADPTCLNCHQADLARAVSPDHAAQGWVNDCQRCHVPTVWDNARFNHPATFPLSAGHGGLSCSDCHSGGVFTGLSTDCATCHMTAYQTAVSPSHSAAGFSTDCNSCHTTGGWRGTNFKHTAAFPLAGGHAGRTCADCHTGGVYTGLSGDCASCHLAKYQATTTPNHAAAGYNTNCTTCHSTTTWLGATFNHPATFPLTAGHGGRTCTDCHTGGVYTGLSTDCVGCHLTKYQATTNPNHAGAGFNTSCVTCHTTTSWLGATFNHTAAFPLTAGHAGRVCTDCHTGGVYTGLSKDCAGCHLDNYQATTNPNHTSAGYNTSCTTCHTTTSWMGASFNHPATFPLTAGHGGRNCVDCHKGGVYTGLSTDCVGCHLTNFQATTNPNHTSAGFNTACATCHTTAGWVGVNFKHTASFPLTGGHGGRACTACHTGGVYTGLSADCVSCHLPKYQATTRPNHATSGFGTACATCHTTGAWVPSTFRHPATFPLTAGHAGRTCTDCHTGGVYTGLSTVCSSCHQAKFQATTNPNHTRAAFPNTCNTCHTTTSWLTATYTHISAFPLTGGHAGRSCNDCHAGGVYKGLPATCVNCHLAKYQATTNPKHSTSGFGTDCKSCHTTTSWLGADFNHPATFPLTNGHAGRSCADCHKGGVYTGLSTLCSSCHLTKYNATTNPRHGAAGFATTCNTCHTTTSWLTATYTHTAAFPLTGGHAGRACNACHTGSVYQGLPAACVNCHLTKYQATTNPNHTASGFGTDCKVCHTTNAWVPATFNHPSTFPLTNGHAGRACTACHIGGVYTGLSTQCVSCHLAKYQATTNPNHASSGFNTDCRTCHSTSAWVPSSFRHPATFPLNNGHAGRACTACHKGGVYTGLSTLCSSCHLAKFQATTNPNHVKAAFPTTCNTCHNTTTWLTATYTHVATFPLTGGHAGRQCNQCHADGVYKSRSNACVSCHLAKYQATTNPNHVTAGFPTTCNTCHTTTSWQGATFNHKATFPLTGGHAGRSCADCHKGGVYTGLSTACVSCHLADYQGTTNPNHTAAGFPTTCNTCHTTTSWQGATFNHTWFPITSGAHNGVECIKCHTTPNNYALFNCTICHTKTKTDNDHRGVNNYVWSSPACYNCHPDGRS